MTNSDRKEILSQLQDAFVTEDKIDHRVATEVVRIDNHNAARLTQIKQPTVEEQLYAKYPDAVNVKEMIAILGSNSETSVKLAGTKLKKMLMDAFNDPVTVGKLVSLSRDFHAKFYSTSNDIKKQMVLYCFVSEMNKI